MQGFSLFYRFMLCDDGMAKSSLPILQDPYFQASLGLAKGVARLVGAQELSPLLLLVGLQLAQQSPKAKVPQTITDNREAIARAASQLGLDPRQKIKPLKPAMPLSQGLRELIVSSGSDLEALVWALLKAVTNLQALDDEAFKVTINYASSLRPSIVSSRFRPTFLLQLPSLLIRTGGS